MVQLVADIRHFQPVNDLRIGRAVRIGVNGAQIVGFLDAGAGIDGDGVEEFFARAFIASLGLAYPGPQHSMA